MTVNELINKLRLIGGETPVMVGVDQEESSEIVSVDIDIEYDKEIDSHVLIIGKE